MIANEERLEELNEIVDSNNLSRNQIAIATGVAFNTIRMYLAGVPLQAQRHREEKELQILRSMKKCFEDEGIKVPSWLRELS